MSDKVILELRGVSKSYGDTPVLEPTDLAVRDGEFLTVLGPSGSGKTTVLRLIGGFTPLSGGQILLDGEDLGAAPIHRRPFNTVFQDYALFPHMTVARNVGYGLSVRKTPRAEIARRVDEALAVVELSDKAARYPAELSGGQRQRVALARAIVCRPRIVLLDEPLAALDAELRRSMQVFLKDIQRQIRTTFIFVTHDQDEAISISDRIVVMNHGRIEQIGSPREVYDHPQSRFVAGFFGENNLLPPGFGGAASSGAEALAIRPESFRIAKPAKAVRPGALAGCVQTITFLGPITEIGVATADDVPPVRVRLPTGETPAWLTIGATVELSWPASAISVLAA